jgi:hypothetical protein
MSEETDDIRPIETIRERLLSWAECIPGDEGEVEYRALIGQLCEPKISTVCDCIDKVNAAYSERGIVLDTVETASYKTGSVKQYLYMPLRYCKSGRLVNYRKVWLEPNYCPFCGVAKRER